jgi:phytoene dehydrogenase-like protein
VHPLAAASPFFRSLDLDVEWIDPPAALAHPFDDGTALLVERSPTTLGPSYERLVRPAIDVAPLLLGRVSCLARKPATAGRFAATAVRGATSVARRLDGEKLETLFLGAAAHSVLPLDRKGTAGFGLALLGLAHSHGWPFPRGGSQAIADALAKRLTDLGGEIETGRDVTSLPVADIVVCDLTPQQLRALAPDALPHRYRRWRDGPGIFKLDYALDAPIPWRAPDVARAGTVHLAGSPAELAESERAAWQGQHAARPFVLLAQQTLFDDTRAPAGKHTAWAYCHVPRGSNVDMRERIEAQIERFAPGFRERVLACATRSGGDISAGATDLPQLARRRGYKTRRRGVYLCSAATFPGPGVHGMCGHLAAREALRAADPPSEG